MTIQRILMFLTALPFVSIIIDGKDTSAALRGSIDVSVRAGQQFEQSKESELPKRDVHRYLLPEDLMALSLWEYMDKVDDISVDDDEYSRFKALITAADRKDDLKELSGITLLAPHNDAISRDMKDFLLGPGNEKILEKIIEYHMIPRIVSFLSSEFKQQFRNGVATVTTFTVSGENIDISVDKNGLNFNKYTHAIAYALTNESILYKIDRLLIPPSLNSKIQEDLLRKNSKGTDANVKPNTDYEFPIAIPNSFLENGAITSDVPSMILSDSPSITPSLSPSDAPSLSPSDAPSLSPSDAPSISPTNAPSTIPSDIPSIFPVKAPLAITNGIVSEDNIAGSTAIPSHVPSSTPSSIPSNVPSSIPSTISSSMPSDTTSTSPSDTPSSIPIVVPSNALNEDIAVVPNFIWEVISHHEIQKKNSS
jgi:uncharacterized surface protein with fasciclin (FAS1) repeats